MGRQTRIIDRIHVPLFVLKVLTGEFHKFMKGVLQNVLGLAGLRFFMQAIHEVNENLVLVIHFAHMNIEARAPFIPDHMLSPFQMIALPRR
jgi:hypothetical protein